MFPKLSGNTTKIHEKIYEKNFRTGRQQLKHWIIQHQVHLHFIFDL